MSIANAGKAENEVEFSVSMGGRKCVNGAKPSEEQSDALLISQELNMLFSQMDITEKW